MKKQETVRPEEGARSGGKKGTSMGDAGLPASSVYFTMGADSEHSRGHVL